MLHLARSLIGLFWVKVLRKVGPCSQQRLQAVHNCGKCIHGGVLCRKGAEWRFQKEDMQLRCLLEVRLEGRAEERTRRVFGMLLRIILAAVCVVSVAV